MKQFLGLRGQALNLAVGAIAGCDFLLFGYGMSWPKVEESRMSKEHLLTTDGSQKIRVLWEASSLYLYSLTNFLILTQTVLV